MQNNGTIVDHLMFQNIHGLVMCGTPAIEAAMAVESSEQVARWKARIKPGFFHHGAPEAFENAANKLIDLGLVIYDLESEPAFCWFVDWFKANADTPGDMHHHFKKAIVAAVLARAQAKSKVLITYMKRRVALLARTARQFDGKIYCRENEVGRVPKAFEGKPFVRPEYWLDNEFLLPTIHDIYGFTRLESLRLTRSERADLDAVIKMIESDAYQSLRNGYGYMAVGSGSARKCYSMGWSVHLPGWRTPPEEEECRECYIQRVELMAHFRVSRKCEWMQRSLRQLETYRTAEGTFLFPRYFLTEKRNGGYWVTGSLMGLEEDRRSSKVIEVESTYRMLNIWRLLGLYKPRTCAL